MKRRLKMIKPIYLMFVRHAQSLENRIHELKMKHPLYLEFLHAWNKNCHADKTILLAKQIRLHFSLNYLDKGMPIVDSRQAVATGKRLNQIFPAPDLIFVSPYKRAKETFEIIRSVWPAIKNKSILVDYRLRERDFGIASQYFDKRVFVTLCPQEKEKMEAEGLENYCYPKGESIADVRLRVNEWLKEVETHYGNARVLAITHYEVLRLIRSTLLGKNKNNELDNIKAENCGVSLYIPTKFGWNEKFYNKKWY